MLFRRPHRHLRLAVFAKHGSTNELALLRLENRYLRDRLAILEKTITIKVLSKPHASVTGGVFVWYNRALEIGIAAYNKSVFSVKLFNVGSVEFLKLIKNLGE